MITLACLGISYWYFSNNHYVLTENLIINDSKIDWKQADTNVLLDFFSRHKTASFLIYKDGEIIAQWGDIHKNFRAHSMRKSLLSALYGTYIKDGLIDSLESLEALQINDKEKLTKVERSARIIDLLKSRSGIYHDAASVTNSVKKIRPKRGIHSPGETWFYNNWDFNALGLILEKKTGDPIFLAFEKRLANPLNFKDFDPNECWYKYEAGSSIPSHKFRISSYDLLQFGRLYLSQGVVENNVVLDFDWIKESFKRHSATKRTGLDAYYGLMWWVSDSQFKYKCYSASGSKGHKLILVPELDLIMVHRVNTDGVRYSLQKPVSWDAFEELLRTIITIVEENGNQPKDTLKSQSAMNKKRSQCGPSVTYLKTSS